MSQGGSAARRRFIRSAAKSFGRCGGEELRAPRRLRREQPES